MMSREQQLYRALQVTSSWLACLSREFRLDEDVSRASIPVDGAIRTECTLGEALDMADAALAAEPSTAET